MAWFYFTPIRGVVVARSGVAKCGEAGQGMGFFNRCIISRKRRTKITNHEWRPDNYKERMSRPDWEDKRQERLKIDEHMCQTCCHDGSNWSLEVHHKTYERFGNENVQTDLITLCRQCHNAVTDVIRRRRYGRRKLTGNYIVTLTQTRKAVPR